MNHATALFCLRRYRQAGPCPRGTALPPEILSLFLVLVSVGCAAAGPGLRRTPLAPLASGAAGFTLQPPGTTGVLFTNTLSQSRHLTNQIYLNGSGVAAGDIDGDGRCDLFFCALDQPNRLYRNLGNWRFEEIAVSAGVACPGLDATGAALADIDGDWDLDLLINSVGQGTHLYLNDGKGHFTEAGPPGGLNGGRGGMSMALADMDGDGDLDVYIANYRVQTIRDQPNTHFKFRTVEGSPVLASIDGKPASDPAIAERFTFRFGTNGDGSGTFRYEENGEPDLFLRNDGGVLTPISFTQGAFLDGQGKPLTKAPADWGLSVMFRDLNGDGSPDLYVCNDFRSPDRIWMNDGQGHFRAADPLAFRQCSLSSMGIDVADINRDGFDDIFVVDMLSPNHERRFSQRMELKPEMPPIGGIDNWPQYPRNMLFVNRGDGTWAELAQLSGLEATEWSWTTVFLDVDLDGWEDILVANGFERDGMNIDVVTEIDRLKRGRDISVMQQLGLRARFPRLATPNLAYRNLGNLRFEDVSAAWGFQLAGVSQGMALADLDNDGDLDVAINNLNEGAALYRNNAPAPRVAVRLRGAPPNTAGIGARIIVRGGAVPTQTQEMICGGRYLSSDDSTRTFAAGSVTNRLSIEVAWRNGVHSVVQEVRPNELIEIAEPVPSNASGGPMLRNAALPKTSLATAPLFVEHESFAHVHFEAPFNDWAVQPGLTHRLSQLGPGVCWFDLDGDGWDDLLIGTGSGGALAAYRNRGEGKFERLSGAPWSRRCPRDLTTILGWNRADGSVAVIAGTTIYEDAVTNGPVAEIIVPSQTNTVDGLPGSNASTGPMAMADYSGDGNLDLFVGGRVIPGRFPEAAPSHLFLGNGVDFRRDDTGSSALTKAGLVSGAVFSDLDGDGRPELVLACQWGPLRVYRLGAGKCTEETGRLGLMDYTGLWNGITTGDFDGDGRMDLAASNWGRNTRYERFRARPIRMIHGVTASDGVAHFVESYAETASGKLRPLQPYHDLMAAMPALREHIPNYTAYSRMTVPEIFGERWPALHELTANRFESTVFLNRGDHFEPVPLPDEAQWAPAFAINAADLDGDGHEDLFLGQNFFAVGPEISRYDAGRSLWLRGDGSGRFVAVKAPESGLFVYGEQRGAAVCDYDADGRVDLVVTQNGAASRMYHNVRGVPGLRVRLKGPPGNRPAIGAVLRCVGRETMGPAREVHAGSGYWSQDSAVSVLSRSETVQRLWVRWPGGQTNLVELPTGAREITVEMPGTTGTTASGIP